MADEDEEDPNVQDPNVLDEIEARANLTTVAGLARHYYLALIAEGFDANQALALTIVRTTPT